MTLDKLGPYKRAVIEEVIAEPSFRRRLLELGFVPGTEIENISPVSTADPKCFLIRGTYISLTLKDAGGVIVNEIR